MRLCQSGTRQPEAALTATGSLKTKQQVGRLKQTTDLLRFSETVSGRNYQPRRTIRTPPCRDWQDEAAGW